MWNDFPRHYRFPHSDTDPEGRYDRREFFTSAMISATLGVDNDNDVDNDNEGKG
jgi:hypothetical protein